MCGKKTKQKYGTSIGIVSNDRFKNLFYSHGCPFKTVINCLVRCPPLLAGKNTMQLNHGSMDSICLPYSYTKYTTITMCTFHDLGRDSHSVLSTSYITYANI